ncbi:bifunctional riboflavin kinase/FAD synthetase [Acetobacterium woodii]|uniref:Riboflavin biosynthesis protein n=1 Tax=Acetobacterium woodii (strain ATCC 29683 / DSM 1030 / JCM 2381 / KCTC 1655 / WB1) TaxID=931626 RepID=H6LJX4_ACEWD|nr:bifunctional riboflavin kinase/FAD synthetase [Acetobacterium woodii]AFA48728.1 bifunctional riboflavin kinase/FMN adenylyltransferase RibC [Acetobacterium woodii DSM 1030]
MTTKSYQGNEIVLALGFFDGVHLGHQALLSETIKIGKNIGCETGVMTFQEHPLELIFPNYTPWLITSNTEKETMIRDFGVDFVFINPFTEELMKLTPEKFITDYLLTKYNVKVIVVGFNYNFGYKGMGTTQTLQELGQKYGFSVVILPPFIINTHSVSSTFIRELISCGQVDEVSTYLGRKYTLSGIVIQGKGLGHQFGIPTANLKLNKKIILPSTGVYYTSVHFKGRCLHGLTNLGFNPTFEKHPFSIETYIYDFDEDIYNQEITIEFIKKIRDEIKFNTINDLINQIKKDISYIRSEYIK